MYTSICSQLTFYSVCSQVYSYIQREAVGSSELSALIYAYDNPSDVAANGQRCDSGINDYCDVVFDVCLSQQGYR